MNPDTQALPADTPLPEPCRSARRRFSLALDERLPPDHQKAVRQHLATCAPCANEWRQWTALSNAVQSLPRAKAPAHLGEDLRRRLQPEVEATPGWSSILRWAAIASIAACLCVLSFLAGARQARTDSPVVAEAPEVAPEVAPSDGRTDERADDGRPLRLVADRPFEGADGGGDTDRFARSTLAFLGDLVQLPTIEPQLRGPLLNAQLVHFDLPEQARRWRSLPVERPTDAGQTLDEAARWIQEAARSLEQDPTAASLEGLRQQILHQDLVPRLRGHLSHQQHRTLAGQDHAVFLPLVREMAPSLPGDFQESMARLLSLKDAWVSDRPTGQGDLDALEFLRVPVQKEMDGAVEALVHQLLSLGDTEDTRTIVEEQSGESGGVQWHIRRVYTESHTFGTPERH